MRQLLPAQLRALPHGHPDRRVARALNFRNGYCDQSAEVWSDDQQLLASSHPFVWYRD